MDLETLDRRMIQITALMTIIDIGMVTIALADKDYYDTLKYPITTFSIIALISCFVGYKVNQKYQKSTQ